VIRGTTELPRPESEEELLGPEAIVPASAGEPA